MYHLLLYQGTCTYSLMQY